MKRNSIFLSICLGVLWLLPHFVSAQTSVSILIGDSACTISEVTTQTELKPGWKIVDIQTNGKLTRYLWGKHSRQFADDQQPTFIIHTGGYKLTDFAIIKLKEKKEYRRFAQHNLYECDFNRIDLDIMEIAILDDDKYRVRFHAPQSPGEYVIVNLKSAPVNDMGDVKVYPYTIVR